MAQLNESYQTPTKSPSEPIPEWRRGRESKAAKSFFQMSLCIDFSVSSLSHVGEFPACSVISEIGTPGHRSDCHQMRSVAGWLRDIDSGSEHEHGESSPNRGMLFFSPLWREHECACAFAPVHAGVRLAAQDRVSCCSCAYPD